MIREVMESEFDTGFQRSEMVSWRRRSRYYEGQWPLLSRYLLDEEILAFDIDLSWRRRSRYYEGQWPLLSRYLLDEEILAFDIDLPHIASSWLEQQQVQKYCRELIYELRTNPTLERLKLGSNLLESLDGADQQELLLAITKNPSLREFTVGDARPIWQGSALPATILHTFSQGSMKLWKLNLFDLKLSTRTEVKNLSESIRRSSCLRELKLHVVSVGAAVASKMDQKEGLLDPIVHAMKEQLQASSLKLSVHDVDSEVLKSGWSLVSTKALRMLLQVGACAQTSDQRGIALEGLHLTDAHCKCIANALLAFPHALTSLSLQRNPGIGESGHQALLALLNRNPSLQSIQVDDRYWNETYRLVIKMNQYGRDKATDHGVFVSRVKWIDWLARLSQSRDDFDAPLFWLSFEDVGAIWYTLLERPDFIYS